MKNSIPAKVLLFAVLIFLIMGNSPIFSTVLDVPDRRQEQTNWCWAASCQAIIWYFGVYNPAQCEIANFAWGVDYCCSNPFCSNCNRGNYIYGHPEYGKSSQLVLEQWGVNNQYWNRAIPLSTVTSDINSGRPFYLSWAWDGGGGHALVGMAVEGNNVGLMDPLLGCAWYSYDWVVDGSNHTWAESLQVKNNPPPAPPPAPASISYPTSSGTGNYTVSWGDSIGATSYQLERTNNGGSTWTQIYSGSGTSRSESVGNGSYGYRVKATNSSGSSSWRTGTHNCVVNIPPPQPPASISYPTASTTGSYTVSWGDSIGATSYQLERTNNGGSTWTQIYSGSGTSRSENVGNGSYGYRVKATNSSGSSSWRTGAHDCVANIILPIIDSSDYNGDGTSDICIFRKSSGLWAIRGITRIYFGGSSDIPISGDYNGDDSSDIGIFRPASGLWAVRGVTRVYFGSSSDTAVPVDYNGDGFCNIGIFRESSGLWAVWGVTRTYFGTVSDRPAPGDYNGDGTKDIALFRGNSGLWALKNVSRVYFGGSNDTCAPGDYSGDGTWRPGIFRASSGLWAVRGVTRTYFGTSFDQPVPADYNGDGNTDVGILRGSSGLWAAKGATRVYFGRTGDMPVSGPPIYPETPTPVPTATPEGYKSPTPGPTVTHQEGLVAYYPFNGNADDESGNGHDGRDYGATLTTDKDGNSNSAYSFDGNDYIFIGDLGSLPSQGTILVWMNASEVVNYRNPLTTDFTGGNDAIRFEEHSSGGFFAAINWASAADDHEYTNSLVADRWYQVVLVWDSGSNNVRGYLDGVPVFDESQFRWPTTMPDVQIGRGFDTNRHWTGKIDEVRIYSRALSQLEIEALYNE